MSGSFSSSTVRDRIVIIGTGGLLAVCPVLVSFESLWPVFVACAITATIGLIVLWFRDVLSTSEVVWGGLLLRILFFPLLPELTDDPFRYIWDGWMQTEGINPYRYAPNAEALEGYWDSPLYDQLNSRPYYSIYPPLTQIIFAIGGVGYSVDWVLSYYLIKLVFVVAECGGVVLLSRLVPARNVLLYAWNPLVLVETAGQAHTEALLVLLIVGAVWAVRRGYARVASLAIAGAGMVKIYPFVLFPYLVRRFGLRVLWPGGLAVVVLCLPYAASYALPHVKESMDLFARLFEFNAGPYYLVKYIFRTFTGEDWSKVIGPVFRGIFVASLPALYALDWWQDWSFRRACLVTIGLLFVFSTTVHPWYFLPVLILSVLAARPTWPWCWLGAASIGTYLFYIGGSYWTWIIVGWGGAAALSIWIYRKQITRTVERLTDAAKQYTRAN